MTLLFRAPERRAITPENWIRGWDVAGSRSLAGERVSFETAIGLDAVAAAVGLLCDVVYMLPVDVYRDRPGPGDPMQVPPLLVRNPSEAVDARTWRAQAMVSWLLWGNAYGLVQARDANGYPTLVDWLDPGAVHAEEPSITKPLRVWVNGQEARPDEILHVPGRYVKPGTRLGLSPLQRFRETYGLAIAARNFGARWFGDGAHPTGVLSTDHQVDEEQATTVKQRFLSAVRGKREPVVLGAGLKYEKVQATPDESQLSQTRQESAVSVARSFGIPPEMIAAAVSGSSVTYANREQRAIDFLTFSMDPWLVRFEELYTANLPRPQYVKINRGALLRTDVLTRYKAHDTAIRVGMRSPNEARALEDEAPIEGGDVYLWPPYSTTPVPQEAQQGGQTE